MKRYICFTLAMIMGLGVGVSDTFEKPKKTSVLSENKVYKFTFVPPALNKTSSLLALYSEDYMFLNFNEHIDGMEDFVCEGRLERIETNGIGKLIWRRPLLNKVAPVNVLVSNDGAVVTFDDWHKIGTGQNVIVIYSTSGKAIKSLKLTDFVSQNVIKKLSSTTSSIDWLYSKNIDYLKGTLQLQLGSTNILSYVEFDLSSGELVDSR